MLVTSMDDAEAISRDFALDALVRRVRGRRGGARSKLVRHGCDQIVQGRRPVRSWTTSTNDRLSCEALVDSGSAVAVAAADMPRKTSKKMGVRGVWSAIDTMLETSRSAVDFTDTRMSRNQGAAPSSVHASSFEPPARVTLFTTASVSSRLADVMPSSDFNLLNVGNARCDGISPSRGGGGGGGGLSGRATRLCCTNHVGTISFGLFWPAAFASMDQWSCGDARTVPSSPLASRL